MPVNLQECKPPVFDADVGCCCEVVRCQCAPEERVLRAYSDLRYTKPMTEAQRRWCVDEADRAGEGEYRREDLEKMPDDQLADTVLMAWWHYVQCNVL